MDLQELLQFAETAIERGEDRSFVDSRIRDITAGAIPDFDTLRSQAALERAEGHKAEADAIDPDLLALNRGGGNALTDFLRMAGQGLSFGFGDELAGLGAAVAPGGRSGSEAMTASRERVNRLRRTSPGASMAAEIAGGAALPFAAGAGFGGRLAARGAPLAGGVIGGATGGALGGALTGLGEGEGVRGRLTGGLMGGVVGGAGGALLGGGLAGTGRLLAHAGGGGGAGGVAVARGAAGRLLKSSGLGPEDIPSQVAQVGPEAVVADLSPTLARGGRAARNLAPEAEMVIDPVAARAGEQGERIGRHVRRSTGINRTFDESKRMADEMVDHVRKQYYRPLEEMYSGGVELGPKLTEAMADPDVATAVRRVRSRLNIAEDQPMTFKALQDVAIDLRDDMGSARALSRPGESARAKAAWDKIRDAMGDEIVGFNEAQRHFAIATRRVDAHGAGWKAANNPVQDIARELQALPPEAQDAYRHGILARFEHQLAESPQGGATAGKLIDRAPNAQARLEILADGDARLAQLMSDLDREGIYRRTYRLFSGNSTTAMQLGDVDALVPASKGQVMSKLMSLISDIPEGQRVEAGEMLAKALSGQGEEMAELMAMEISLMHRLSSLTKGGLSIPGGLGAAGGTAAGREISN